jgi:hypothetical protein
MARFVRPWAGAIAGMAHGFGRLVATLARQNKLAFRPLLGSVGDRWGLPAAKWLLPLPTCKQSTGGKRIP